MEEVGSLFAESGYSRLPIYQDSIDNIVGVIHEKDFYAARYRGETMISALKAPVLYTTGRPDLLEQFLAEGHDPKFIGAPMPIQTYMHRDWETFTREGL